MLYQLCHIHLPLAWGLVDLPLDDLSSIETPILYQLKVAEISKSFPRATIFSDPPSPEYKRMVQLLLALGNEIESDVRMGAHLPELFKKAGYSEPQTRKDQPKYRTGEAKRYWEYTLYEVAPTLIKAGIIKPDELSDLSTRLSRIGIDNTVTVAQAVKSQVWAIKAVT
jgi:hypothetical protein